MAKKHKSTGLLGTQFATSCISTSLVLVMLGSIVLFILIARNLSVNMRENINVSLLLNDTFKTADINKTAAEFKAKPYVKNLKYISKEQAAKEESEAMGTDPTEFIGYNPFTASFEVNITADYANKDSLSKIVNTLKADDRIVDVIYQKELMDAINRNIRKLSMILLVIAGLFTYISFALINNTVRLTIFSRRFSIYTMKLVGASWGFIRRPFMNGALLLGLLSAIIADAILAAGLHWLITYEPEIKAVIDLNAIIIVGTSVLILGLLFTTICTYASLSKYLRMSGNELYNI